ncbi:YhcB family protein [Halomonas sp. V046]|uniref:YhcB family protein n=1 Tax=Halomonas sp. V046 TaxID=3459611 RepID=UPI004044DBCE
MEASNINMVLAAACLVAGTGIGALGYHLLNAGARNAQRLKLRLTERERQLTEWKDGVDEHLRGMDELVHRLVEDGQSLRQALDDSARRLGSDAIAAPIAEVPATQEEEDIAVPRDYADGNRGTLSEDFGLRKAGEEEHSPHPQRY